MDGPGLYIGRRRRHSYIWHRRRRFQISNVSLRQLNSGHAKGPLGLLMLHSNRLFVVTTCTTPALLVCLVRSDLVTSCSARL
jgi:hypothetical protein